MDAPESISNYFLNRMQEAGLYYTKPLMDLEISEEILSSIEEKTIIRYHILPIDKVNKRLVLVTDTENTFKQKVLLEKTLDHKIKLILADEDNLKMALLKFYDIKNYHQNGRLQQRTIEEDITPLKSVINTMLQDAAKLEASDIHILPTSLGINVRFRINGHIYDMSSDYDFSTSQITNVVSIIKQLDTSGNVDFMRTNMPNEGSFYLTHGNQEIFIRMETLPVGNETENLEKINMRLLSQTKSSKKFLDSIGYTEDDLKTIKRVLFKNATGLFLNSGPTGAGKTTSLYAQIYYVIDAKGEPLNVITMDDPIEIREETFTQVQIRHASNETLNLTAGKILTASLRSDPDIILYNEIRDAAAATIAMQASSTGHKVFSTVHATDCISTISRLMDFDVSKITLLSELKLIISQRLVAKLCPQCSRPHDLSDLEKSVLDSNEIKELSQSCMREIGKKEEIATCSNPFCNHGFVGRTAIAEFVEFNMEIRDALMNQKSFSEVRAILEQNNFRTMWQKGFELVKRGEISLKELISVVGKE